jgi:poly(A) polymerase
MVDLAKTVCKQIQDNGFRAFFVGGCVRDTMLGKTPKDIDIVTNADPDYIHEIFKGEKVLDMGKAFGIVTVVIKGVPFEIATTRSDVGGHDSRHPGYVIMGCDIETDLARRDFTMNAIAFDPLTEGMVDPFNGVSDIQAGIIRFVGDANQRIKEDHLRVLRAVRFCSQLGFEIDDFAIDAMKGVSLDGVSAERIQAEMAKILTGKNAVAALRIMRDTGILWKVFPDLEHQLEPHNSPYHQESDETGNSIMAHTFKVVESMAARCVGETNETRLVLMLSALLHDIGKPFVRESRGDHDRFMKHDIVGAKMVEKLLTDAKWPAHIVKIVAKLVRSHMMVHDLTKIKKVWKARELMGNQDFPLMMKLGMADEEATVNDLGTQGALQKAIDSWNSRFPVMLPEPLVTGMDLILAGCEPGPKFGEALRQARINQLNGNNNKAALLASAIKLAGGANAKLTV